MSYKMPHLYNHNIISLGEPYPKLLTSTGSNADWQQWTQCRGLQRRRGAGPVIGQHQGCCLLPQRTPRDHRCPLRPQLVRRKHLIHSITCLNVKTRVSNKSWSLCEEYKGKIKWTHLRHRGLCSCCKYRLCLHIGGIAARGGHFPQSPGSIQSVSIPRNCPPQGVEHCRPCPLWLWEE